MQSNMKFFLLIFIFSPGISRRKKNLSDTLSVKAEFLCSNNSFHQFLFPNNSFHQQFSNSCVRFLSGAEFDSGKFLEQIGNKAWNWLKPMRELSKGIGAAEQSSHTLCLYQLWGVVLCLCINAFLIKWTNPDWRQVEIAKYSTKFQY